MSLYLFLWGLHCTLLTSLVNVGISCNAPMLQVIGKISLFSLLKSASFGYTNGFRGNGQHIHDWFSFPTRRILDVCSISNTTVTISGME